MATTKKKVATKKVPVKKAIPKKKVAPRKKVVKKVETPVIVKEDPGYEVVVGDEIVDDVEAGEERAQHDEPFNQEIPDPMDNADWIHPGVQSIPTPKEEAKLKAQGEADREAKRLADEILKQEAEAALEVPDKEENKEEE